MFFSCIAVFASKKGFLPLLLGGMLSVAGRVRHIICTDLSRQWKLRDVSSRLYMSESQSASGCENGLCTPSVTGPSAGQQGGRAVWLCKHILFYLRVQGMFWRHASPDAGASGARAA